MWRNREHGETGVGGQGADHSEQDPEDPACLSRCSVLRGDEEVMLSRGPQTLGALTRRDEGGPCPWLGASNRDLRKAQR